MAFDPTAHGPYTGVANWRILFWNGQKWSDFEYTSANRKKFIGLDDLLRDHENEQKRLNERKSKQRKIQKASDALDDDAIEARLSECVDKCQKEINQINGDEEMPFWFLGIRKRSLSSSVLS